MTRFPYIIDLSALVILSYLSLFTSIIVPVMCIKLNVIILSVRLYMDGYPQISSETLQCIRSGALFFVLLVFGNQLGHLRLNQIRMHWYDLCSIIVAGIRRYYFSFINSTISSILQSSIMQISCKVFNVILLFLRNESSVPVLKP